MKSHISQRPPHRVRGASSPHRTQGPLCCAWWHREQIHCSLVFPQLGVSSGGDHRWKCYWLFRFPCPKSRIPGIRNFRLFKFWVGSGGSWDATTPDVGLASSRQDKDTFNLGPSWENCGSNPTCWLSVPSPPGLIQFSFKLALLCCSNRPWASRHRPRNTCYNFICWVEEVPILVCLLNKQKLRLDCKWLFKKHVLSFSWDETNTLESIMLF